MYIIPTRSEIRGVLAKCWLIFESNLSDTCKGVVTGKRTGDPQQLAACNAIKSPTASSAG